MASKTSLRPAIQKIAEAVYNYATTQGFAKNDYALAGTFDPNSDRVSLFFGTDRQIDEREWYAGILQEIRKSFSDYLWMIRNIGLVVEHVNNLDEVYLHFASAEDERDLNELLERSMEQLEREKLDWAVSLVARAD